MKRLLLSLAVCFLTAVATPCFSFDTPDVAVQDSDNCTAYFEQGLGYTTSIFSTTDNGNGTYTIRLRVEHDGCSGWFCKELDYFAVEAEPGTYSDISVDLLEGNFNYEDINLGPDIGESFDGFKVNNTSGIGNGQAGAFLVTYTLNGELQNQKVKIKAGFLSLTDEFRVEDFEFVQACGGNDPVIIPYYDPLGVGKVNDIIGYELRALYFSNEEGSLNPEDVDDIYQIVGSSVLISVFVQPGEYANTLSELASAPYNMTNLVGDPVLNTITGLYPIENLLLLNERDDILIAASPVFPPLNNVGLITSQGDTAMRSFIARDVFDVDGTGIKVGVLSDSYNTKLDNQATDDVIRGDLPGVENANYPSPVDVIQEFPYGEASDEGRAMLQIIHDVAPGAELAFRTAFNGSPDFAQGIVELKDAGCDVIVDDVTYISEPFFRDGAIAQSVDIVTAEGVAYFSAAGNFGTNSWEGIFEGVTAPEGVGGDAHNFAPEGNPVDISQNVTLAAGQYTIVLQWDDGTPGLTTSSDFDIYLANNDDIAFFGFNRENIGGFPIEVLPFTVLADGAQSNLQIIRSAVADGFDTTTPTRLKYIVFRGDLEINEYEDLNASTITGQANAEGAMAVGAVLYTNTPEYGEPEPTVASFSSRGGTPVNGTLRNKPEFCGPNVVNTSVDLGGGFDFEGDGFPNFIGTSAAAPHAAGLAALVLHARNKFYGDDLNPAALKEILQSTAKDMYEPGYDIESGSGYLLADSALNSIINPSAFLITVTYDTTIVPGIQEIPITITGEYLNGSSEVYFNGQPLETPSELQGDTAITAIIPTYDPAITFPEIQVNNQPQPGTNGLDGGLSNVVYLNTKTTILIDIQDTVKTYGEQLPEFTANYFLSTLSGNLPIDSAGLTDEEMERIMNIDLTTIANSLSNVGLWGIEADSNDPLNPLSDVEATDPLDIGLLEDFKITVSNGLMTVVPLDLVIDPRDTTLVYNDSLVGFDFNYIFNLNDSLNISEDDELALISNLRSVHATPLINRTAGLVRVTALVNDLGEPLITEESLANISFMISSAVRLVRKTALVNGGLIDPEAFYEATAFANSTSRLVRKTALVNGYNLVRKTALVNNFNEDGDLIETIELENSETLANSTGELNTSTFNLNSNYETIVILGEGDISILSGDSTGTVETESINIVTGETVGNHFILPGAYLSNNFNISYLPGSLTIIPDTAYLEIEAESLNQTYDGIPKEISVSALPDTLEFTVTYDGDTIPPTDAGSYNIEVLPVDSNYFGSASATLIISPAFAIVSIEPSSLVQFYDGTARSVQVSSTPEIDLTVTYHGSDEIPIDAGIYEVVISSTDPNFVGSATTELQILPVSAAISFDASSFSQEFDGSPKEVIVNTVPEDLDITVTYNLESTAPINVGIYDVDVLVNDPNYSGSASAILEITPTTAQISIDDESLVQVFDGNERSISAITEPEGIALEVTYSGVEGLPVDAGSYDVNIEIADANYSGSRTAQFLIEPAQAAISLSSLSQTYDGEEKPVITATDPGGLNVAVTYNGSSEAPVEVGTYLVEAQLNDENFSGAINDVLEIDPAGVVIAFNDLTKEYDGTEKSVVVQTDPPGLNVEITYNGSSEFPVDAGSYEVDAIVFDDNFVGSESAILQIEPREVTIALSQSVYGIDLGDAIPEFDLEFDGFAEGQDASLLTSTSFNFWPEFDNEPGEYLIKPIAEAPNYSFIPEVGVLYVNPSGPGTTLIVPEFECYEYLDEPDENGFQYLAHFSYTNNNPTPVYIPKGLNNRLGAADHDASNQPEVFVPGGGNFSIPFEGGILKWLVRSNDKNGLKQNKGTMTWNNECIQLQSKSNSPRNDSKNVELNATIFPNPSSGKTYVQYAGADISLANIEVFNSYGDRVSVPAPLANKHIMEIDLSGQSSGLYVVRISGKGWAKALNVVVE